MTTTTPEASDPIVYGLALSTPVAVVQRLADALTRYHTRPGTRWRAPDVWLQAVLTGDLLPTPARQPPVTT